MPHGVAERPYEVDQRRYRRARADPRRVRLLRDPAGPHLGFGGNGAHYCLGANLARMEIDLIFNAIADGMPGITRAGEPKRLRSAWINGIKELPVRYG